MKKIFRVILVILIIVAIIGFGIFAFNYYNGKELQILTAEVNRLLEIDLAEDTIDTEIKCNGKFGDIEKTIKTYLNDSQKIYKDIVSVYDELNADNLFYAEDLDVDKLKEIQKNLNTYEEKAKSLSEKYKEQNTVSKKKEYSKLINGFGASYYRNVYISLIDSEVVNSELLLVNDKVDTEYQNITTRIYNTDKVIDFLVVNKNYWEVKNGRIQFTNVNKLAEYYQILNKDIQE